MRHILYGMRCCRVSRIAPGIVIVLQVIAFGSVAALQPTPTPLAVTSHDFIVKDFRFQNGATLSEVRIHYRTIGTPARDSSGRIGNAVLVLHGSSGDAGQVLASSFTDPLMRAGGPLDAARHYLIFPDNLGNGRSTKPSDGLRARFPNYGYGDMVELQRRLVMDHLGIVRLRSIIGISMGAMHAWMWGVRHPAAMDSLIPIAALPTPIQGRNLLWRTILTTAIRADPEWKGGDYTAPPRGFLAIMPMFDMLVQSPARLAETVTTRDAARAHLRAVMEETIEEDDANNILYRFEASYDYNVEADLHRIEAPVLAILFEDDELNPTNVGDLTALMRRVKNGRMVIVPAGPQTEGHRTQVKAAVWREHVAKFMAGLPAR